MADIKENFQKWLTQAQNNNAANTKLTAYEYMRRLIRLCQKLYGKEDWKQLLEDIYILILIHTNSHHWLNITSKDLNSVTVYLYSYKHKNRNFNNHYNQFFHSIRKQFDLPLSSVAKKTSYYFEIFRNTEEYVKLSDWIKHIFTTEKDLKYLSWLYSNKIEKRKMLVALSKFSTFLLSTCSAPEGIMGLLNKEVLGLKRKNKSNDYIEIDEANGVEGRNFYSIYTEGKAEKLLSIKETSYALGCSEMTIRRLLEKKKLNFKGDTGGISTESVRKFLKRRHTKRKEGKITDEDCEKKSDNWVKMKDAEIISRRSATYIRKQVKNGRVAFTRYGLRKFLYFKPDLLKIQDNKKHL